MKSAKRILLVALVLGALAAIAIPSIAFSSNCGGNSAALAAVRQYVTLVITYASDADTAPFSIGTASADQLKSFANIAHDPWLPNAHFLVLRNLADGEADGGTRIIIVCDTPYANVPRRYFWHNEPTHAVGFADGHADLISAEQYASLDKSSFVRLDDLVPR